MYIYQEFPKWKYHPEKEPVIVDDKKAEKSLGKNWFDSPADLPEKESDKGDEE